MSTYLLKKVLLVNRFEITFPITVENFHYSHYKWENYAEYFILL